MQSKPRSAWEKLFYRTLSAVTFAMQSKPRFASQKFQLKKNTTEKFYYELKTQARKVKGQSSDQLRLLRKTAFLCHIQNANAG